MKTKINRNTKWTTLDGREIPIRCLTDIHLANLIKHVQDNIRLYPIHEERMDILNALKKESKFRKLSHEFLNSAPIPWQDVDGQWKRFNRDKGKYVVIGR